jgi:hypothetical protein
MRLATWNCQPGLASNWDVIEELDANVVAIQEARPDTEDLVAEHDDWDCIWQEGVYYPGLATLVRKPFTIDRREPSDRFADALELFPERSRDVLRRAARASQAERDELAGPAPQGAEWPRPRGLR